MKPRALALRSGAAVAIVSLVTIALVVALTRDSEPAYRFAEDCGAMDIQQGNPSCTSSTVHISVRPGGDFERQRDTVYPREPFDDLVFDIEGNVGTTEEYLASAQEETQQAADERGDEISLEYAVAEDHVTVSIVETITAADGRAATWGVTTNDDQIHVAMELAFVAPSTKVVLHAPGPVSDTNGAANGNTAVWDSAALMSVEQLTAVAEATSPASRPVWALVLLPVAALGAIVALYAYARRPGSVGGSGDDGFDDEADTPDDLDDEPEDGDSVREPRGE